MIVGSVIDQGKSISLSSYQVVFKYKAVGVSFAVAVGEVMVNVPVPVPSAYHAFIR